MAGDKRVERGQGRWQKGRVLLSVQKEFCFIALEVDTVDQLP